MFLTVLETMISSFLIVFPAAQIYHMQVQITGLVKPGQTPDFTRNGVATCYVVVPEFSGALSASLIMALMIGMVLLIRQGPSTKSY